MDQQNLREARMGQLKACMGQLIEVDGSLRALNPEANVPGDGTPRSRQIALLAERREALLNEKRTLEGLLANEKEWPQKR